MIFREKEARLKTLSQINTFVKLHMRGENQKRHT